MKRQDHPHRCGWCTGPEGARLAHCRGKVETCLCDCTGRLVAASVLIGSAA